MRCSEEFLEQLRLLHQAAADTDGRVSRTDILHELVGQAFQDLQSGVNSAKALADRTGG